MARVDQGWLDAGELSGHSLRARLLTAAAASRTAVWKMAEVSRRCKNETPPGYARLAEQFTNHAGQGFM